MPQIIRAQHLGFCFGVRDALAVASAVEHPEDTVVYGQLVHNAQVTQSLRQTGLATLAETERARIPAQSNVLVTAHGISQRRYTELVRAGKQLIDTTCPLVRRVHDVTAALVQRGYFVIVLGMRDHVEVQGIVEDLPDGRWLVVSEVSEVICVDDHQIGIVCQTTLPESLGLACRDRIAELNPHANLRLVNTICRPTKQRQAAVDQLCDRVSAVVIVGGANSNNTRRLTQRCLDRGCRAIQVESAAELREQWFDGYHEIGLTAGTSTPDEVIDEVEDWLKNLVCNGDRASCPQPASDANLIRPRRSVPVNNREWVRYFEKNLGSEPGIPWSSEPTLSDVERRSVARSIQTFQLGESGEGRHIRRCAADWVLRGGDPAYLDALKLFLQEENQHATWLGRFLQQENIPLLEQQWSDSCFRKLRHLAGLHTSITVLLTAEILAQVYYLALWRATESPALGAICKRVLRDERFHVIFQQRQKVALSRQWSAPRRMVVAVQERLLFAAASRIVWHDHKPVFLAAKMNWPSYINRCNNRWRVAIHQAPKAE